MPRPLVTELGGTGRNDGQIDFDPSATYPSGTVGSYLEMALGLLSVSGTNTLTATASWYSAYATGDSIRILAAATNTGPVTLNVNSLGAKNLLDSTGLKLSPGALVSGETYAAVYNGSAFVMQSTAAPTAVRRGPRSVVQYGSATSVNVRETSMQMAGFRFMGGYSKVYAPTYPTPTQVNNISTSTDLGAETSVALENWYGIFACANDGDTTCTFKIMPFLRAGSVAGSVVTLNKAGEGIHSVVAKTYAWTATNNLTGVDCLVISEGGGFSGRLTSITANTGTTITLATIGSVAAFDFMLPAPPGFTQYCYLGSFYFDTAEVRNIYDSGSLVKSKGIYILSPTINGSQPLNGVEMNAAGYISPLACAVVVDSSCTLSTSSAGDYAEYLVGDGSGHIVQSDVVYKDNATNMSVSFSNGQVPFLYYQKFYYANAGSLASTRVSGQLNVTGWIEP